MTIIKRNPLFLLSVIVTSQLIIGCSTAPTLPKSKDLLAAEVYYEKVSDELKESQPVESELDKANETLKSAIQAKTEQEMAAMVYISTNQIKTAIQASEVEASKERTREIRALKSDLRNKSQQTEKEK
jgi:hypothetical protein